MTERKKRKIITLEIEQKLVELRAAGWTVDKIAIELDIGMTTAHRFCKKYNMPDIKIKITSEVSNKIMELFNSGIFPPEIAAKLNLAPTTITKFLKSNNILKIGRSYSTGLTFEQENKIKELFGLGFGREKISQMLDVSESYLRTYCRNMNIKNAKVFSGKINEKIGKEIISLHANGLNTPQIGKIYNISATSIAKYLNKEGIIICQPLSEEQKLEKKYLKKLRKNVSGSIHQALKKALSSDYNESFTKYITYSIKELKIHIESQFESWMTWDNWGVYLPKIWDDNNKDTWTWHIDHIIPESTFKYTSMEDQSFKDCWALSNLRPLNAKQNVAEGAQRTRHPKTQAQLFVDNIVV